MAEITITESNLKFVLDDGRLFRPEKEDFYTKLSSQVSIRICDFLFVTSDEHLWIVEVKSSAPKDNAALVQEIKQKFLDSLLIYVATWANRANTPTRYLPPLLQTPDALQRRIRLILIIKDHKPDWLPPLRDSLQKACRPLEKLFSLEETQVHNQDSARRKLRLTIHE